MIPKFEATSTTGVQEVSQTPEGRRTIGGSVAVSGLYQAFYSL